MRPKSKRTLAVLAVFLGALCLYAASADPVGGSCLVDPVSDPGGVHLTGSGTIAYYDGCYRYPLAVPVFVVVNGIGASLVGAGLVTLLRARRDPRRTLPK
ncbi:hypothetical protein [Halegenticoccus tardaugens]|uniref:hypothetical protein n=1 Tax=Halegenticoccus tardaugens TaxID=2071624 RepID=UPI00100A8DE9|nr:hypothetical protein [Halegenticoccus tardaugens]